MRRWGKSRANFAQAKSKGISIEKTLDFFKANAIYKLARMFKVSPDVIERRIDKDDLMRGLKEKL